VTSPETTRTVGAMITVECDGAVLRLLRVIYDRVWTNWGSARLCFADRGGKQDVHLSVKPLPKHMRLLPIIEEAVSKIAIMKARVLPQPVSPDTLTSCWPYSQLAAKPVLSQQPSQRATRTIGKVVTARPVKNPALLQLSCSSRRAGDGDGRRVQRPRAGQPEAAAQ